MAFLAPASGSQLHSFCRGSWGHSRKGHGPILGGAANGWVVTCSWWEEAA